MITGVRWLSAVPGTGHGDASEAYLSGLREVGVPVTWTPLGWPSERWRAPYGPVDLDRSEQDGFVHGDIADLAVEHDVVVVCSPSPPLWHDRLAVEATGRLLAAYTTWETDRLPQESVHTLNRYDRVLVPSRFNADVFESSGVTAPLIVVPHSARCLQPPAISAPGRREGRFVFYLIATWTSRKAILDTVSAYLSAFSSDDDVLLVIHTTPEDHVASARLAYRREQVTDPTRATWFTLARAVAGRERAPAITLSTRRLTRAEVDALHARSDCFVCLSRGEGWGLGAFDAAAFARPVIVTGWGGTLDFLPDGYPYCVDYDLVPTITDDADSWWEPRPGERWAKARTGHAATLLRHVFEHRDEAASWGRLLRSGVETNFARSQVTRRLIDALDPKGSAIRSQSAVASS